MPKMKTRRSVSKRVRVTARGKVKHWHPNKSHLLRKKSRKKKRQLRKAGYLTAHLAGEFCTLVPYA